MWHIMKTELERFFKVGAVAALAHLAFWQVALASTNLSALGLKETAAALAVACVAAAAFGLYQIGSLKKPGTWTFLIHRPLPRLQIFAGLVAAGCIWLTGVVALPVFLTLLRADKMSPDFIDGRHYGLPLMLLGVAWFVYGAALLSRLSPSRLAFMVIVLMPLFVTTSAPGWRAGAVLIASLAVVWWLAAAHFKADLESPPRSRTVAGAMAVLVTVGVAVCLSWSILIAYSFGVAFVEHGLSGPAKHSWNDYYPPQSVDFMTYRDGRQTFEAGLARLDTEPARALLPQIALADTAELHKGSSPYPRRHGPMYNFAPAILNDDEAQVAWTFSHREMLLRGVHQRTQVEVGWLGPEGFMDTAGEPRFTSVPVGGAGFLLTPEALLEVDFKTRRITERFRPPSGEHPSSGLVRIGARYLMLTERALYLFDRHRWQSRFEAAEPVARVELPARIGRLERIHAAELLDGFLISMIFDDQRGQGPESAFQWLADVSMDGEVTPIGQLALTQGQPDVVRFPTIFTSPAGFAADRALFRWISPRTPTWRFGDGFGFHLSPSAWRLLVLCCLTAAILAWLSAGRRRLDPAARRLWTLWCLIAGPAGFVAMLFLTETAPATEAAASAPLGHTPALAAVVGTWSTTP